MTEQIADVVRARRLEIVDARGRTRIVLGMDDENHPRIDVLQRSGGGIIASLHVVEGKDGDEEGSWMFGTGGHILLDVGIGNGRPVADVQAPPIGRVVPIGPPVDAFADALAASASVTPST